MEPNAITDVVLFKAKPGLDITKMQTVAKQLDMMHFGPCRQPTRA